MMSEMLGVLEQRLERAEAQHLVEDLLDQPLALAAPHQFGVFGEGRIHALSDARRACPRLRRGDDLHLLDEPPVDAVLELLVRIRLAQLRRGCGLGPAWS